MGTHRVFLSVLVGLLGTLAWTVTPAQAATKTFSFTGGAQTFVVPSGVHLLHVLLIGGSGGQGGVAASGGAAAEVTADLKVTPGETLYIEVAGNGEDSGEGGEGGFNGGADGGGGAGGGGGASDIRLVPGSSLLSLESRLVIAAGGGGGGGDGFTSPPGDGGDAGSAGETNEGGNEGGGAGTAFAGGGGGFGNNESGDSGELGSGGAGGNGEQGTNGGGGGGGGLYGGGGGGGGLNAGGGGGGGGSSLAPGGESKVASASAAPKVEITYTPPPSIEIVSPVNGATFAQGQSATAIYSCAAQEGVGLVSCKGTVANGGALDTSTLGAHALTVEAEDAKGGFSAKAVSYTVVAVPRPATIIDTHPRKVIKTTKKRVKVKFTFHSPTAGATFQCKLDKGAYVACGSPKKYKVKVGKHKFSVRAVKGGVVDPTPASFKFKVVKAS